MTTNKCTFTRTDISEMKKEIKNFAAINIPNKDIIDLLNKASIKIQITIKEGCDGKYGLDTLARETLLDLIATKFVKMRWPLGQDSKKYNTEFFTKLLKVCKKKKWKIDLSEDDFEDPNIFYYH